MNARPLRFAVGFALTLGLAAPAMAQATKSSTTTTTTTKKAAGKVDLNTATAAELEEIPGIGPARAAEIVKARPFKSMAEVKAIRGISSSVYAELLLHATVGETVMRKAAPRTTVKESTTKATTPITGGKVDLNTATAAELEEIPGIGPARAAEIVKARPFKSMAEVKAIKGISSSVFAELLLHATVGEVVTKTTTTKEVTPSGSSSKTSTTREVMPKSAAKTATKATTKKAAAAESAREDDPQHLTRKKDALAAGRMININTATTDELQELPGIGPVRAAAIIKERPFDTIEDIMKVDGIKQGIFGHIKGNISVK
jgi:competence ComEA-like helix-hairpin-helix protein